MRGVIGIDGREYKLLLDPAGFAGAPSHKAAKAFWNRRLKPIIEKQLRAKDDEASRAEGELAPKKQRVVTFLDTKKGLLAKHGFALRQRTAIEKGEPVGRTEVTLKFRSPDFLIAAEYCRAAKANGGGGDTTLEEDIGPLQVPRGKKPVAVAEPRSIYSRFAVSTKVKPDDSFETLGDAFSRFGALEQSLRRDSDGEDLGPVRLHSGPTICEWVFQEAAVDLGDKLDAEFAFTLWYFGKGGGLRGLYKRAMSGALDPRIAEISFDFKTQAGRLDTEAAERATKLFIGMQEKLPVNKEEASKTKLGLPTGA
jgi:hypothetical protein